jgi:hypothetical protein
LSLSNTNTRNLQAGTALNINTSEFLVEERIFQQKLRTQWRSSFAYTTGGALRDRHWETGLGFDLRFQQKEVVSVQIRSMWQNPNRDGGFSEFRFWINYTHEM